MGLQEAWDDAWERVKKAGETGIIPERIPTSDGTEVYRIKNYLTVWVGPLPTNISCSCLAAGYGSICKHRAILLRYRAGFNTPINCPWCREDNGEVLSPAGYHIFCEMDILAADAQFLTEHTRMAYHAKRIRDFYLKGGLNIPIDPGKRDPLSDLWE